MADTIEHMGHHYNRTYKICTERCSDLDNPFAIQNLALRHPNIKNIWYGWVGSNDTEKPSFVIERPLKALNDIWKNICQLNSGTYLIGADTQRILNIYHKRWLTKRNGFTVIERGQILDTPFLIVKKTKG